MKELKKKVNFNKGGNGGITPRLNLNLKWLSEIGVNEDNREVLVILDKDNKQIIIKKDE